MPSNEDPNAWLGLLKWSLAHQDGTAPSDARPMTDEDRAWLEKVVKEGVRDDFKVMTDVHSRLCAYLDNAAAAAVTARASDAATTTTTSGVTPLPSSPPPPPPSSPPTTGTEGETAGQQQQEGEEQEASSSLGHGSSYGALSTFVAPVVPPPTPPAGEGGGGGGGGSGEAADAAVLEGVMNDLEELQDIVEQIDMAQTFVKIGGFGRLIALVAPACRPEKLRLRAASVIATINKNNPPAQEAFYSSAGHGALLRAVAVVPGDAGGESPPLPSPPQPKKASLALQRAVLHALSSSVMGIAAREDALCSEPGFPEFLAGGLSQDGGEDEGEGEGAGESLNLRSKAAFVLKALLSAPEASRQRAEALWPAVVGLLVGLEAIAGEGGEGGEHPGAAREMCIEALLAAARSPDGDRVVRELGPRVFRIMARRRDTLVEARGAGSSGAEHDDVESAEFELGLWLEWESRTGPAQ